MTRFEVAWAGYQNHAEETGNPDAEERLYDALANLALVVGIVSSVKQPSSLASSLDELMAAYGNDARSMQFAWDFTMELLICMQIYYGE